MSDSQERALLDDAFRRLEEGLEHRLRDDRRRLILDVANLRGLEALDWFWKRWQGLWRETSHDLLELRDELQEVWRSDGRYTKVAPLVTDDLLLIASGQRIDLQLTETISGRGGATAPQDIVNKWLSWRPSAEQEDSRKLSYRNNAMALAAKPNARSLFGENLDGLVAIELSMQGQRNVTAPFTCSLFSRKLIPQPFNLRSLLVQGVLDHWGHLKYCANAQCLSPYFIAKRKDQTVCDAEICKAERQREHALKWWTENRAKKTSKTDRSTAKKGGMKKNGTHKAR